MLAVTRRAVLAISVFCASCAPAGPLVPGEIVSEGHPQDREQCTAQPELPWCEQ